MIANTIITILGTGIFSIVMAILVGMWWDGNAANRLDAQEGRSREIKELYHDHN